MKTFTLTAFLLPVLLGSCGGASAGGANAPSKLAAPPLTPSSPPKATAAPIAPAKETAPPAMQATSGALPLSVDADERGTIVFVAEGNGRAGTQAFRAGALVFVRPGSPFALDGAGRGFVFRVQPLAIVFQVVDGPYLAIPPASRERLVWAKGKMAATAYFSDPSFYVGALEGSMPVAEHVHESSWELLCATRASGSFTLDGVASRLANGGCVSVPPGHKHSWTPDPGTSLEAVQVYSPGGPEARFRTLAAQDAAGPGMQ